MRPQKWKFYKGIILAVFIKTASDPENFAEQKNPNGNPSAPSVTRYWREI